MLIKPCKPGTMPDCFSKCLKRILISDHTSDGVAAYDWPQSILSKFEMNSPSYSPLSTLDMAELVATTGVPSLGSNSCDQVSHRIVVPQLANCSDSSF